MSHLPVELLLAIFGWVEDDYTLFNLRLTSRSFSLVATPFAFRGLAVKDNISSVEALVCLQNSGGAITSAVGELVFKEGSKWEYPDTKAVRQALCAAFSELPKFCNLTSLRFGFYSFPAGFVEDLLPFLLLQMALFSELAAHPPPPLVSLALENLIPFDTDTYADDSFQSIFRTLETLRISVRSRVYGNAESNQVFWSVSIPHMLRSAHHLTSMALLSDQPIGISPMAHLDGIHFPALTALTLRHFILQPPASPDDHDHDALAFILRHGPTLTHLTLDECAVYGGAAGTAVYPRPWHVVLRRLEAELVNLRSLTLTADERVGRVTRPLGYLDLNAWDIYRRVAFEVGHEDEDAIALESLMSTVDSRRTAFRI
ncbi:hypothetical protein C8R46DRAFT_1059055 [Mycena filopes]|nr:hypothetical protein C8R46DRAFT_1059055 [Mycena filopes]